MFFLFKDKLFIVLVALLSITLLSFFLNIFFNISVNPSLNVDAKNLGILIIVLAFLKVRLIIIHYMEAGKAYLPIRIAFELWVLVVAGITIALYLY